MIIALIIVCCVFLAIQWAEGIQYMKDNHPNYKGNDLFGIDEDDYIG